MISVGRVVPVEISRDEREVVIFSRQHCLNGRMSKTFMKRRDLDVMSSRGDGLNHPVKIDTVVPAHERFYDEYVHSFWSAE